MTLECQQQKAGDTWLNCLLSNSLFVVIASGTGTPAYAAHTYVIYMLLYCLLFLSRNECRQATHTHIHIHSYTYISPPSGCQMSCCFTLHPHFRAKVTQKSTKNVLFTVAVVVLALPVAHLINCILLRGAHT